MKIITAAIALALASCTGALAAEPPADPAAPQYDPTDPEQLAACVAWADDTYAWCLGVVCRTEDPMDLIRRVNHCRAVYDHISVCCSGFAPDPDSCPEIPVP